MNFEVLHKTRNCDCRIAVSLELMCRQLVARQTGEADAFTVVRGTRGYLGPEWFASNNLITEKCDVFSFGLVVLEIIGGRNNVDFKVSSMKFYFHIWVYDQIVGNNLSEIVDKHLCWDVDAEQVMLLAKLALACVQEDPAPRPSVSNCVLFRHCFWFN